MFYDIKKFENQICDNEFWKPIIFKWMKTDYLENWIIIYIYLKILESGLVLSNTNYF
jgi:hypothetical protein